MLSSFVGKPVFETLRDAWDALNDAFLDETLAELAAREAGGPLDRPLPDAQA